MVIAVSGRMTDTTTPGAVGTILVVEDDPLVINALRRLFELNNYAVEVCENGASALPMYRRVSPDAIVLDLRLPGMPGIDVCRIIRSESQFVPIVILSGVTDVTHRVVLLELGADDYVTKPFSPRELLARVRAAIRHSISPTALRVATLGPTVLDEFSGAQGKSDSTSIHLTPQEDKIVELFLKNPGRVLSREELITKVYGSKRNEHSRKIDEHIMRIRKKLEREPSHPTHFCTVHREGYKFIP